MYICVCVCQSTVLCVACVSLSMIVISNQSSSKSHVICVKPSVNLIPRCIKHTERCRGY